MSENQLRILAGFNGILCLIVTLQAPSSRSGEPGQRDVLNLTAIYSARQETSLQDLAGFWSYNETFDISKYEDFDHSKFLDMPGIKFDDPPPPGVEALWPEGADLGQFASPPPHDLPVFDNTLITNISAQLGGTAFLHCRVRNANDLRVSWVRRRDWHIISSGALTYTNDERFQVIHNENTEDWDLQIKFVQKRDNGTYECQVATSSGIISHYYNLHVVVPAAFILGSGDYHIGEGSTISLVCIIENSPTPPQYVFWYHNDKMVNYDSARGGVTVSTEPGPKTHSRLIVNKATPADTGNYTCRAPNTEPDTIHVFVSKEGENTAAIQRQRAALSHNPLRSVVLLLLAASLCL
ncbi:uncharacterized protein LOC128997052 [Macrosteles quadrilineatus]|uniref:uncharacterized protein LOC128996857 n=1 Tax=Macrosteles quadrilineatus TaxID=74068 RepID=UPI0023E21B69|nr:uncharacterized protein LOC128996857 [Macrosteles quadrilineatus]XP_054278609.1 uncharacterized protein LOC128997052 [Macrosteles quadrilineatus]